MGEMADMVNDDTPEEQLQQYHDMAVFAKACLAMIDSPANQEFFRREREKREGD